MPRREKAKPEPIDWDAYYQQRDAEDRADRVGHTNVAADFPGARISREQDNQWSATDAEKFTRALAALKKGDLGIIQETLLGQMMTLNTAYQRNIQRGQYDKAIEFQKATVKTARALADISRPKSITFVKTQQNLAVMQTETAQNALPEAKSEPIAPAISPAIALDAEAIEIPTGTH
jgi:hypothetical protein